MEHQINIPHVPEDAALPIIKDERDQIIELQQELIQLLKEKIKTLQGF